MYYRHGKFQGKKGQGVFQHVARAPCWSMGLRWLPEEVGFGPSCEDISTGPEGKHCQDSLFSAASSLQAPPQPPAAPRLARDLPGTRFPTLTTHSGHWEVNDPERNPGLLASLPVSIPWGRKFLWGFSLPRVPELANLPANCLLCSSLPCLARPHPPRVPDPLPPRLRWSPPLCSPGPRGCLPAQP